MINKIKHTSAIILSRSNYAESDRIVKFLTRDYGKLSAIAKGCRKERSKLAGGIELFSVSDIGFINGKGDLATLVSSRLVNHYDTFLGDLEKVDFAYACLKSINKITAAAADKNYFLLVEELFESLNNPNLQLPVINLWWYARLTDITGHTVNAVRPIKGGVFKEDGTYMFDASHGGFLPSDDGVFSSSHVKYMNLNINNTPLALSNIKGSTKLASDLIPYLKSFVEYVY